MIEIRALIIFLRMIIDRQRYNTLKYVSILIISRHTPGVTSIARLKETNNIKIKHNIKSEKLSLIMFYISRI